MSERIRGSYELTTMRYTNRRILYFGPKTLWHWFSGSLQNSNNICQFIWFGLQKIFIFADNGLIFIYVMQPLTGTHITAYKQQELIRR